MCFTPQRRALFWHRNFQKWSEPGLFCAFFTCKCASRHNSVHFFDISPSKSGPNVMCFLAFSTCKCVRSTPEHTFSTSQLPKVVRTWDFFFTSKRASRHNSAHFFDISTSKSGPNVRCFSFFTCKCVRSTTACTFSTSQLPKVLRTWCVLAFSLANVLRATTECKFSSLIWPAGSAPAALASLLFDPPEPQIIGKTPPWWLSYLFAHLDLLSSETFSSLPFPSLPFHSLLFPSLPFSSLLFPSLPFPSLLVSSLLFSSPLLSSLLCSALLFSSLLFSILLLHLCFSSVHIVWSLTSKLPSVTGFKSMDMKNQCYSCVVQQTKSEDLLDRYFHKCGLNDDIPVSPSA